MFSIILRLNLNRRDQTGLGWVASKFKQYRYRRNSYSLSTVVMSSPSHSNFVSVSSKIPVQELLPFCGCFCCVTSLYTEFPDCVGCSGNRICLCCYSDYIACKLPHEDETVFCHWDKGHTYCAPVETFCMVRFKFYAVTTQYFDKICFSILAKHIFRTEDSSFAAMCDVPSP